MSSRPTSFVTSILQDSPISEGKKAYFQERFKAHLHELIVDVFRSCESVGDITRADLARKLGKRPEQVSRWLNTSGNLQLSTVSDVLLGLGYEPVLSAKPLGEQLRNHNGPDWLATNTASVSNVVRSSSESNVGATGTSSQYTTSTWKQSKDPEHV